jgi:hypothetical protein
VPGVTTDSNGKPINVKKAKTRAEISVPIIISDQEVIKDNLI